MVWHMYIPDFSPLILHRCICFLHILTEEDLAIVKKCGDFLGQSDYKGQQNHFELLHNRLDGQIAEAAEEIRTKGKMYSRLGMSAGCIIAVVMM